MKLIELYNLLAVPEGEKRVFNALAIPEYPEFRIAIDSEGNTVLLLSVSKRVKDISLKNFRLKHLQLEQNIECKIIEKGLNELHTFTVITFKSIDGTLQQYFLRVAETLIKTVGTNPTQQQVVDSLKNFVQIFQALTDTPTNTVSGLWAELFVIDNSSNPEILLNYWHNKPEEKFDFNAGMERIEVKSSSAFERKHTFSSEQLNPPEGTQVVVASIFMKQNASGISVEQLMDSISDKVSNNYDLITKLSSIVIKTLANTLEHSIGIKFDYEIAKQSIRFYKHQDIEKIENVFIPGNVTDVHYKSDLSNIAPLEKSYFTNSNLLYDGL